ncbi:MAG TPA: formylglycine-generating enzyme family protein [Phycisphaerae bacterium]
MFSWFKKPHRGLKGVEIDFLPIPSGTFIMGQGPDEPGIDGTAPQHQVTFTRPYNMSAKTITRDQFQRFVDATNYITSAEKTGTAVVNWKSRKGISWRSQVLYPPETLPITYVSWDDAVAFCLWASSITKSTIRLPTEAKWEYACRAGTSTAYAGEIEEMGWHAGNSGDAPFNCGELVRISTKAFSNAMAERRCRVHGVGLKRPNAWGLHDMHGNVWQWCQDVFAPYPICSRHGPQGRQ